MKNSIYDQENADQQWIESVNRKRGEDIYGENYYGDGYRHPNKSRFPDYDRNRKGQLSGFDYGDQGTENITNYGRDDEYERGRSQSDNYRYRDDRRRNEQGMGDWWQEEGPSRTGYTTNQERAERQGLHRGKGPKNYTRSDDRIKDDINDRLSDDSFIDASDIEVNVTSCEVTLNGTVESRDAKRRADDIAESVSGVKNVENRIKVSGNTDWPSWKY